MSKPYFNILTAYELSEHEPPPAHIAEMLTSLQTVVDMAYQDGYQAAILHLEREYKS